MADNANSNWPEQGTDPAAPDASPEPPAQNGDSSPVFGDPSQWTDPAGPGQAQPSQQPWDTPDHQPWPGASDPQQAPRREMTDDERWHELWEGTWKIDRERKKAGLPPIDRSNEPGLFDFLGQVDPDPSKSNGTRITFGFDIAAFALFILYLIPQVVWLALPAPNDLLREVGSLGMLEMIAGGFSMISFLTMVTMVNVTESKGKRVLKPTLKNGYAVLSLLCMVGYFATWWLYYQGNVTPLVMGLNAVLPLLSFVLHLFMRRNWVSLVPMTVFIVCQLASSFSNFVMG